MSRLLLTTIVALALTAVSVVYTWCLRPLTRIEPVPMVAPPVSEIQQPRSLSSIVQAHLSDQAWVSQARKSFQQGDEAFLFFDEIEPIPGSANRVRLTPCALVWKVEGEGSAEPYTIVCETARVEFINDFYATAMDLGDGTPGRIIAGALQGAVQITGPHGLMIQGQDFVFSEQAQHLYSDHPVHFAYGPLPGEHDRVEGSALGLEISLTPSTSAALGDDMPRIAGVRWVQLRRHVSLQIDTLDDDGQPARIDASCDGSFIYDLEHGLASMDRNVRIQKPTGVVNGRRLTDSLECRHLTLEFIESLVRASPVSGNVLAIWNSPESESQGLLHSYSARRPHDVLQQPDLIAPDVNDTPQTGSGSSSRRTLDRLVLNRLQADGEPVRLRSDRAGLTTLARLVYYEAPAQTLVLAGQDRDVVQAQVGQHRLWGRQLRLFHDDQQTLISAECVGAGGFQQLVMGTDQVEYEALWNEKASLSPDEASPDRLLTAEGSARFVQPGRAGIRADLVQVWIKPEAFEGTRLPRAGQEHIGARHPLSRGPQPTPLPITRARARGNVLMMTPQAAIRTQDVEAHFTEESLTHLAADPHQEQLRGGEFAGGMNAPQSIPTPEWEVSADKIVAYLQHDPALDLLHLGALEGNGSIRLDHKPADSSTPGGVTGEATPAVHVTGRRFQLLNSGGAHQTLKLFGHPAHLELGDVALEGDDLELDRLANRITIKGPGSLRFPVTEGLTGMPLEQPERMHVQWRERLIFNGETAEFLSGVKVSLTDSMLLCERMTATLNRRISFLEEHPELTDLALAGFVCHDRVKVEVYDWEFPPAGDQPILQSIRKGDLADFQANLRTGEFSARGPGEVHDWTRGGTRRVMLASSSVQANQPADQSEALAWEYSHLRFTGTLRGNFHDQVAELTERVEVLYAPVEHALSTFRRNDLSSRSRSAQDAAWLKCDRMQIRLQEVEEAWGQRHSCIQVAARGHAELEGQLFRALADEVTYDEITGMFGMRGLGQKAAIYYRESLDADYNRFPAQSISFAPRRNHLMLDGSPGIWGVQSAGYVEPDR